jgi:hypothetical protein
MTGRPRLQALTGTDTKGAHGRPRSIATLDRLVRRSMTNRRRFLATAPGAMTAVAATAVAFPMSSLDPGSSAACPRPRPSPGIVTDAAGKPVAAFVAGSVV